MNKFGWIAWAFVACSVVGCSSGTGTSGGSGSGQFQAGSFCDSLCAKYSSCDTSTDVGTCHAACTNENAVMAPKLRPEYINAVASCFATKDCATVLTSGAVSSCADQASASLAPSAAGTSFCTAMQNAATKCGSSLNVATCLTISKQYNDLTLSAAQSCASKACGDMDTCLNAQLGQAVGSPATSNNSCEWAYDGVCDEGSYCDYGTDTYDCT